MGCTQLGALGDEQRGPTVCARGGTELVLPLKDNFFRQFPKRLDPCDETFCTDVESPSMPVTNTRMKYCIFFSNRLNALNSATMVQYPESLAKDSIYI